MSQPENISANDLVKPLADSMPQVTNPGAPGEAIPPGTDSARKAEPVQTAPESKPPGTAMGVDSINRPFDASKFRPEKDILGRWKNLRGGKAKGAVSANRPVDTARKAETAPESQPGGIKPPPPPQPGASVIPPDEPAPAPIPPGLPPGTDRYSLAAETYLFASYSLLDGAFAGKGEWMPDDQAEHDALKGALTGWLRSRQSEDLPPGAVFGLAAIGFAAKRFQRPNTQTRWRIYWLYLRAWWGNRAARAKLAELASTQQSAATS
jgi:hypothetical protein